MPDLVDMKREMKEDDSGLDLSPPNPYGYGLQLYLNDDQLEKLGFSSGLEAGTLVTISGKGIVESTTKSVDVKDGKDVRMSVQITHLGMTKAGLAENAADILYPSENKGD